MTTTAIAADLAELARLVQRLSPDWQNPARFYDARSDIADRIRRAAGALDGEPRDRPVSAGELPQHRQRQAGAAMTPR